jgi:hypothetical protein
VESRDHVAAIVEPEARRLAHTLGCYGVLTRWQLAELSVARRWQPGRFVDALDSGIERGMIRATSAAASTRQGGRGRARRTRPGTTYVPFTKAPAVGARRVSIDRASSRSTDVNPARAATVLLTPTCRRALGALIASGNRVVVTGVGGLFPGETDQRRAPPPPIAAAGCELGRCRVCRSRALLQARWRSTRPGRPMPRRVRNRASTWTRLRRRRSRS